MDINGIRARATVFGLVLRGGFPPTDDDGVPRQPSGEPYGTLLMFGQLGSSLWSSFATSDEYTDGKPDPLDRWSHRIGSTLAEELSGQALFPFEGPPWYPFGQWAQKAESIRPSPLGILMHPRYGLWHAYRFAIALPGTIAVPSVPEAALASHKDSEVVTQSDSTVAHACDRCTDRPCLSACPVNAFAEGYYDVASCCDYLNATDDAPCHHLGCLARGACPEGPDTGYVDKHKQFHMRQFLLAMNRRAHDSKQDSI